MNLVIACLHVVIKFASVRPFSPTLQVGAFGAITRFESVPNRKVLFDVAFAGPAAGGISLFDALVACCFPSRQFISCQLSFPGSILVGTLARVILGSAVQGPLVDVHPYCDWMAGLGDRVELDASWAAGWGSDCSGNLRTQNSWANNSGDVNCAGTRVSNPIALYWQV